MASISKEGKRRTIQFMGANGKRRSIRLGQVSDRQAQAVKMRVEDLVAVSITGDTPKDDTQHWVTRLDDRFHQKLAAAGLVPERKRTRTTVKALMDDFLSSAVVKPGTIIAYDQTRRHLVEHFGETKLVRDVTPVDAEKWRQWLKGRLSPATVSRRVKVARQAFKKAVIWGLIARNPFTDVVAGSQANRDRMYLVSRAETQAIIDAATDAQWRLLIALSRYGGLRVPSEALALKWSDILWDRNRIRIPSCKTEHHAGKDCRYIPLFPELHQPLMDVFEQAPEGSDFIITRYRDATQNLRTQLLRIINRAGLKPWPKLWHNMRSSRQTELSETYPTHVVCAWMGNSRMVAQEHYLQIVDAHFDRAAQESPEGVKKALQNPVQQAHAIPAMDGNGSCEMPFSGPLERVATPCGTMTYSPLGPEGLEHTAKSPTKPTFPETGGAESGARGARGADTPLPADLLTVIRRWGVLSREARQAVLAIVNQEKVN